jgi:hypothetical protein
MMGRYVANQLNGGHILIKQNSNVNSNNSSTNNDKAKVTMGRWLDETREEAPWNGFHLKEQ